MPIILWDASALAKRYYPEIGTDSVDAIFAEVLPSNMVITFGGYAETYSIILRARNRGDFAADAAAEAKSSLRMEFLENDDVEFILADEHDILSGIELMERHNLNSSDASILAAYLRYRRSVLHHGVQFILVATDRRLLRAATVEGVYCFNPDSISPTDVRSQLGST